MPGFNRIGNYVDAYNNGQWNFSHFRKLPNQASVAGFWFDLSLAPGYPPSNFYSGSSGEATIPSPRLGAFVGVDNVSATKYLFRASIMAPSANGVPSTWVLCDYLIYYPFVDITLSDTQLMDNTVTLDRYTSGNGVMAMVVAQYPTGGTSTLSYTYVNSDGVTRSQSGVVLNTTTNIAAILSSGPAGSWPGPFLPLASGDKGIRSIVDITFTSPTSAGAAAFVLVKPLATLTLTDIRTAAEVSFAERPSVPSVIYNNACLNWIGVSATGSISGIPVIGSIETVWSNP